MPAVVSTSLEFTEAAVGTKLAERCCVGSANSTAPNHFVTRTFLTTLFLPCTTRFVFVEVRAVNEPSSVNLCPAALQVSEKPSSLSEPFVALSWIDDGGALQETASFIAPVSDAFTA